MNIFSKLFKKKTVVDMPPMPSRKTVIEMMYDKHLNTFSDEVVFELCPTPFFKDSMQAGATVVTQETQEGSGNERGNKDLPIASGGKGGEASHKNTGTKIKKLKIGDNAHNKGNDSTPYPPAFQEGSQAVESHNAHAAKDTYKVRNEGSAQTL